MFPSSGGSGGPDSPGVGGGGGSKYPPPPGALGHYLTHHGYGHHHAYYASGGGGAVPVPPSVSSAVGASSSSSEAYLYPESVPNPSWYGGGATPPAQYLHAPGLYGAPDWGSSGHGFFAEEVPPGGVSPYFRMGYGRKPQEAEDGEEREREEDAKEDIRNGDEEEEEVSHVDKAPPFEWIGAKQRNKSASGKEGNSRTRTKDKYRVVYSDHQRLELEKEFHYSRYITIRRKAELATGLGLTERQVKIWFQNRRAKERKQLKKRDEIVSKDSRDSSVGGQLAFSPSTAAAAAAAAMLHHVPHQLASHTNHAHIHQHNHHPHLS